MADHLGTWLDNPENRIPLRANDQFAVHLKSRRGGGWTGDAVNRDLLALRLYPGLALDRAFGPGGACGGVEAPNWNACNPRCGNTIFDATQLAFLKDTADRIRSYVDDGRIGTTQRLLLEDQLDELTTAIADHESRPAPGHGG